MKLKILALLGFGFILFSDQLALAKDDTNTLQSQENKSEKKKEYGQLEKAHHSNTVLQTLDYEDESK